MVVRMCEKNAFRCGLLVNMSLSIPFFITTSYIFGTILTHFNDSDDAISLTPVAFGV